MDFSLYNSKNTVYSSILKFIEKYCLQRYQKFVKEKSVLGDNKLIDKI